MHIDKATFENRDVFVYFGDISKDGYHQISTVLEQKQNKKNVVCLILITYGGDPNAGYRISRALNCHYSSVEILIPDVCKSAGTLMCVGAHKLIIGDRGELGPLDIQLSKPDEIYESRSGLDIIQAINALEYQVLNSFRRYLMDIRTGSGLTTKMAADIAAKLTQGFISPIAEKIDPITLGEHQRAMQIALDYGQRLNDMASSLLDNSALNRLISAYPCHGFVIDRKEAATIFKNVLKPADNDTNVLYEWARNFISQNHGFTVVDDVEKISESIQKNNHCLEEKPTLGESNEHEHENK